MATAKKKKKTTAAQRARAYRKAAAEADHVKLLMRARRR